MLGGLLNGEINSQNLPQVGMVLDGYQIVGLLGKGGMGAVYKVEKQGAIYALKVILDPLESDLQRFEQEAVTLAAARHPNIVGVHTIQINGSWPYILFEFIDGQDLSSKITQGQPWSLDQCLQIFDPLALALDDIHRKEIVHRDLKPANILIRSSDEAPILTDFGIAKNQDLESLTQRGELVGTVNYMAPEQFSGDAVSAQTDLWALAVILYQLLSGGKLPFVGVNLVQLAQQIMNKNHRSLTDHGPTVSPELTHLFSKALAKDPGKRYQSASLFLEDCHKILRGDQITRGRARKTQFIVGFLLTLSLVFGAAFVLYQKGQDWEKSRKLEAQGLREAIDAFNDDLSKHYLEHCLGSEKERPCCAISREIEARGEAFEQETRAGGEGILSWKDPEPYLRSFARLRPSLASFNFIHSGRFKASELNEALKYKNQRLMKAAHLFANREFEDASEALEGHSNLSGPWRRTIRILKAACAFEQKNFDEAYLLLDGLEDRPGQSLTLIRWRRSVDIHLSVEDVFKKSGKLNRSRRILSRLTKRTKSERALFQEWNAVFNKRFRSFKPKNPYSLETAIMRHRELSYEYPLLETLTLSEKVLRLCLESARKRQDKGAIFGYVAKLKAQKLDCKISKELSRAFLKSGGVDYGEVCNTLQLDVGAKRGRLFDHLSFVLETGRQGYYLEALDSAKQRAALANDRSVLELIRRESADPFLCFWRAFIQDRPGTDQELSSFDDFHFAIQHPKLPDVYKALAFSELARRLFDRQARMNKATTKKILTRCHELLDQALTLPHPRPNHIHILRLRLYYAECKNTEQFRAKFAPMLDCVKAVEVILERRLKLTEARDLLNQRPSGQPLARMTRDIYLPKSYYCIQERGHLHFLTSDYEKALAYYLRYLKHSFTKRSLDAVILCIEKLPAFRDFDALLKISDKWLRHPDTGASAKPIFRAFRGKVEAIQKARQ